MIERLSHVPSYSLGPDRTFHRRRRLLNSAAQKEGLTQKVGRFLRKRRVTCGPRGLDPYRKVGDPEGPRRRVRTGDAGSGDAGLQGNVAGWWCAVGPVPSPGGLRLWNPVLGEFKQRLKIRQGCPLEPRPTSLISPSNAECTTSKHPPSGHGLFPAARECLDRLDRPHCRPPRRTD